MMTIRVVLLDRELESLPATTKPNTFPVFKRPSGLGWMISRAPFVNPNSGNLKYPSRRSTP
jgi:hypothetical protein